MLVVAMTKVLRVPPQCHPDSAVDAVAVTAEDGGLPGAQDWEPVNGQSQDQSIRALLPSTKRKGEWKRRD